MRTSESIAKIASDLAKAHKLIKHAQKDANNSHFKNSYATLESCIDATKDHLLDNNIVVMQTMSVDGVNLTTRLQHTSGEFYEGDVKIVLAKNDMQGLGSAITYARRYGLQALCNMASQDDDGNAASARKPAPAKPDKKREVPPKGTPTHSTDEF